MNISNSTSKLDPISATVFNTNQTENSFIELECDVLEFNLYFDGTWNSKENSNLYNNPNRPLQQRNQKEFNPKSQLLNFSLSNSSISFSRAPTGIDQMHRATTTSNPHLIALYVDGSGTETPKTLADGSKKYKGDNVIGAGTGWGSTGVYAKLETMLKQIQDALQKYIADGHKLPVSITFNVYGFSRGAATARMFCNRIIKQKDNVNQVLQYVDLVQFNVNLKFVGLFDTVSSIGFDHCNDVAADGQGLDFDAQQISKIVHIAAAHEYRQKFNLTNIAVAVQRGYGLEFALPGCHTDIGDGLGTLGNIDENGQWFVSARDDDQQCILQRAKKYVANPDISIHSRNPIPVSRAESVAKQSQQYADYAVVRENLIRDGWFQENEIFERSDEKYQQLVIDRKQISLDYPKISTYLMIELSKKYHAYYLQEDKLKLYSIAHAEFPDELQQMYDNLKQQMLQLDSEAGKSALTELREDKKNGQPRLDIQDDEALRKKMYNRYLHWGAAMKQGRMDSIIQVNVGQIDHSSNQFYRTIVAG